MNNYKIFNWQGKELMRVEADSMDVTESGQIKLWRIKGAPGHGDYEATIVAVFPDGTLIVQSDALYSKRQFDFVNQREEAKKLKDRNEYIFADQTRNFQIGDIDEGKRKYDTKKVVAEREANEYTDTERKLYDMKPEDDGKPFEFKAAKETLTSTGNGKLDESQEERVMNEIEESKAEEKKRKNREYAKEYYKKQREREGKSYTPKEGDHSDSGSERHDETVNDLNDDEWQWE